MSWGMFLIVEQFFVRRKQRCQGRGGCLRLELFGLQVFLDIDVLVGQGKELDKLICELGLGKWIEFSFNFYKIKLGI